MNVSRQKHPSSKKDNQKSVTYSVAHIQFGRRPSDFESVVFSRGSRAIKAPDLVALAIK